MPTRTKVLNPDTDTLSQFPNYTVFVKGLFDQNSLAFTYQAFLLNEKRSIVSDDCEAFIDELRSTQNRSDATLAENIEKALLEAIENEKIAVRELVIPEDSPLPEKQANLPKSRRFNWRDILNL